jgi:peptidyl-prolyl cis-trans isomerase SurA
MRPKTLLAMCLTLGLALGLAAPPVTAQSDPFAPVLYVNDSVITRYELEQRILFLRAVNTPGDVEAQARKALIDNRVQVQEARRQEVEISEEDLTAGIAEFAGRANLTTEQFTVVLSERGVDPQTLRDFVRAGLLWREVVRARFGPRVVINNNEVDNALAPTALRGGVRLLLSELIIPAPPEQARDALALAEELSATISGEAAFAEAAAQFSAAPSAQQGGRIDWLVADNLPPPISALLLGLAPGQVSAPVQLPNAVALFLLRSVAETGQRPAASVTVRYAQVLFPDTTEGLAAAQRMQVEADTCNDLYGLARDLPEQQLVFSTSPPDAIPGDIGLQLAKLDPREATTSLRRGGSRVLLMLCSREVIPEAPPPPPAAEGAEAAKAPEPPTRDQVRSQLFNQQIGQQAEAWLADLVANATIREP